MPDPELTAEQKQKIYEEMKAKEEQQEKEQEAAEAQLKKLIKGLLTRPERFSEAVSADGKYRSLIDSSPIQYANTAAVTIDNTGSVIVRLFSFDEYPHSSNPKEGPKELAITGTPPKAFAKIALSPGTALDLGKALLATVREIELQEEASQGNQGSEGSEGTEQ